MQRRKFLQFVGATTFSLFELPRISGPKCAAAEVYRGFTTFTSPPYPIPLPADGGTDLTDPEKFSKIVVVDDLIVPPEFEKQLLISWGDRVGPPESPITIGYNCDHLSIVPRRGVPGEYFLTINHEYVSIRPWMQSLTQVTGRPVPKLRVYPDAQTGKDKPIQQLRLDDMLFALDGRQSIGGYPDFAAAADELATAMFDELGVSIVHLRESGGKLQVLRNSNLHRRITGISRFNVPAAPVFRGPGARFLPAPRGTFSNCSGATTPWNTVLTCEENFQEHLPEAITPGGKLLDTRPYQLGSLHPDPESGIPALWYGLGTCLREPLDSRTFGWVCEVDPETGTLVKHTSLGRFRHENVALSYRTGEPLRGYMGDDRRGGHIWRFQSAKKNGDPSKLLEEGELCTAQFNHDYSGRWIPIALTTPVVRPNPESTSLGFLILPKRPEGGPVIVSNRPKVREARQGISVAEWVQSIEKYAGKPFHTIKLADLVEGSNDEEKQLVLLMDAFLMANACGGTPSARPEDLEVHPQDGSVFIGFTDSRGSGEGAPDIRIFPESKEETSRQYGAIYRIVESSSPGQFSWGKFLSSGEVADGGAGFAAVDNLAFDGAGNLWFVCDIFSEAHNQPPVDHGMEGTAKLRSVGIFGNSSMFMVPTSGPYSGVPRLFATGPMESELTGINFHSDPLLGELLLIAVQHPGETYGRGTGKSEIRSFSLRTRQGRSFRQERTVPLGSNFPHLPDKLPRPSVVIVTRRQ